MSSASHPRRRKIATAILILTWVAAFTATHLPAEAVPTAPVGAAVLHAIGYAVLASLLRWVLALHGHARLRPTVAVLIALVPYAILDECTQPLVGRHASFLDVLADLAGVVAALAIFEAAVAIRRRRA